MLSCGPLFLGHPGGRFSPLKRLKNTSPMNDFANLRFQHHRQMQVLFGKVAVSKLKWGFETKKKEKIFFKLQSESSFLFFLPNMDSDYFKSCQAV